MKILHIDDTESILESFQKILSLYGHEIISSADGKTGLKLLEEQKFDLIFLDLTMPDFSGFDFINELNMSKRNSNKIIVFTAMTLTDKQKIFLTEKGINEIITKPIDIEILTTIIEKYQNEMIIHG